MSSDNGTVLTRDELTEALCVTTWGGLTKSQLISKRPGSCKFHPKHPQTKSGALLYGLENFGDGFDKLMNNIDILGC